MSNNVPSEVKVNAISANLKALHALLAVAATRSAEGHQLIQSGECNGASAPYSNWIASWMTPRRSLERRLHFTV